MYKLLLDVPVVDINDLYLSFWTLAKIFLII